MGVRRGRHTCATKRLSNKQQTQKCVLILLVSASVLSGARATATYILHNYGCTVRLTAFGINRRRKKVVERKWQRAERQQIVA